MSEAAAPSRPNLFAPATAAVLVVVGVVAFCILFAGSALDEGPNEKLNVGENALSKSAVGYSGFVDLLQRMGRPATVARGALTPAAQVRSMVVLTLDGGDPRQNLGELPTTTGVRGPLLVVSRKWLAVRDPRKLGFVRKAGLARVPIDTWLGPTPKGRSPITLDREKGRAAHTLYFRGEGGWSQGFPTGPVEAFQTFRASAEDWTPLVIDEKGRTVVMAAKKSTLFALSEPDLLNNQGIADLANAQAGLWIVDYVAKDRGSLVFDVTLNGFERSRSFLKTMFTPPFLAATLCGLAALMLIIWHGFFRFGRERAEEREFALGKRALADNQAALFKMVRREHRLGGRYAAIVRDLVARAVGAPRELSGEALDAFLDRMGAGGRTSWPLTTLAADLETARTADDLVEAAGRLHHWRLEMTRERQ